jgi:hypothetical protein
MVTYWIFIKRKKDIDKKDLIGLPLPPGGTTNNLFVGSTTELQRFLLNQNRSDNVIDINQYQKDE